MRGIKKKKKSHTLGLHLARRLYTVERRPCLLFLLRLIIFSVPMNQREGKSREEAEKCKPFSGKTETFYMRKAPSFHLGMTLSFTP